MNIPYLLFFLFFTVQLSIGHNFLIGQNHQIKIVGHRGAKKFAPENTLASFRKAIEMGVDLIEFDVRQIKDGHFVVMHDRSVSRTTNGTGVVKKMNLSDIKQLDAGSWFSDEFKNEPVPTLKETLDLMRGKVIPDIDFKAGDPQELIQFLDQEGWLDSTRITLHPTSENQLRELRNLTDQIHFRPSCSGGINALGQFKTSTGARIVNVNWIAFSGSYIRAIHKEGLQAFVNCLRRADKKRRMKKAIAAGADYIQADNLDVLIPLIKGSVD